MQARTARQIRAEVRKEFEVLDCAKVRLLFTYDADSGRLLSRPYKTWRGSSGSLNADGYRQLMIYRRLYMEHRLVWLYHFGDWPDGEIDHINHDRLDNRVENLRVVDRLANARNRALCRGTSPGTTGIRKMRGGRWEARIGAGGMTHLGTFDTIDEAISARRVAEKEFGYHANHGHNLECAR